MSLKRQIFGNMAPQQQYNMFLSDMKWMSCHRRRIQAENYNLEEKFKSILLYLEQLSQIQ